MGTLEAALKRFVGLHNPKPVFILRAEGMCRHCRARFPTYLMLATGLGRFNRGGKVTAAEAVEDLLCENCRPRSS